MYGEDPSNAMPVRNVLYISYSLYMVQIDLFLGGWEGNHLVGSSKLEINVILQTNFLTSLLPVQVVMSLFEVLFIEDLVYARHSQRYKDE